MQSWQKLPWVETQDGSAVVGPRGSAIWRRLIWPVVLLPFYLLSVSLPAVAQTNLVTNGTFQVTGGTTSFQFGTWGGYTSNESVTGWTSTGYNFIFLPGSSAANGDFGTANVTFWGAAGTEVSNGYTVPVPGGGNFMALDADYPSTDSKGNLATAAASQTINGLTAGKTYNVSFAWAGAQQEGYTGATTENLTVSLGSSSQTTKTVNLASEGFSGWMNQTFSFVATSSSEVLSFLAGGSPAIPPFVLVANVSLTPAPEPASVVVLMTGFTVLAGIASRRRRRLASARIQGT